MIPIELVGSIVEFHGEIGQVRDPHGIIGLIGVIGEGTKDGRIGHRASIFVTVGDHPPISTAVGVAVDQGRILVRRGGTVETLKGAKVMEASVDGITDDTTPKSALFERLEIEASDDSEVIGASLEGEPQVGPFTRVGVDDLARGQDDLKVLHVITDQTISGREEG